MRQRSRSGRFLKGHARRGRRLRLAGPHKLSVSVSPRKHRVTLKRRSPFKRRLRGYRVNPYVAEYLMNPRRGHRSGRGRRHNPAGAGLMKSMTGVFDLRVLQQGAVATFGTLSTLTIGNWVLVQLQGYVPVAMQVGIIGTVTKAAVRAGVAWAIDQYVVGLVTRDHTSYRIGAAIGIVGSGMLELMGKTLRIGLGDGTQTIAEFTPAALSGYVRGGPTALRSYVRTPQGMGRAGGVGSLSGALGNDAHARLYGGEG